MCKCLELNFNVGGRIQAKSSKFLSVFCSISNQCPLKLITISVMYFQNRTFRKLYSCTFWVEVIYFSYSNSAVEVVFKFMKLFKIPYLKPIFKPIFFGSEWLSFMASFKQLSLNCVFEMAEWESILASALNCYMSIMHMYSLI